MAKHDPSRDDPSKPSRSSYRDEVRLKAFLRPAAAIIATERGLNVQSRLKLESLAKHQNLTDDLFAEAIRQLQGEENVLPNLSRYEQEFVKFLGGEFKKMKSGIVSLRMEQNAIDLAAKKYQIHPIRAEQLFDQQAKLASLGRMSRGDAEQYAKQFISERIGDRLELDQDLHDELYKRGHNLGLSRDRIEAEIIRLLEANRLAGKPRLLTAWRLAGLLFLAICIVLGSIGSVWLPISTTQPKEDPVGPQPEIVAISEQLAPDWMSESTRELVVNSLGGETKSIDLVSRLLATDPDLQRLGYQQLTGLACRKSGTNHKQLENLIGRLFFENSDETVALEMLEMVSGILKQNEGLSASVDPFEQQFRANRLLGSIYYDAGQNDEAVHQIEQANVGARKQVVAEWIESLTGIVPENCLFPDFIQLSERGISVDQWNHVIQNSWASPSQAGLLVQPLYDLTRSRLAPASLNQFRFRSIKTILERDARQWVQLRQPIRETISAADEVELIDWIRLFQNSTNSAFQEFVGPLLVQKTNVSTSSMRPADVSIALEYFISKYRNRVLKPFLDRNQQLTQATQAILESLLVDSSHTPDQIAQLAFMTNVNLAFSQQIRRNDIGQEDDFSKIDKMMMMARQKIRLRELVSLPEKSAAGSPGTPPTASDINRKNRAIEKIRNLSDDSPTTRINALNELEKIAARFDDLAYGESKILARYFLSDLKDRETLNIQRLISTFDGWPNLGLAIGDEIADLDVTIDQALTITRLFFNRDFEIPAGDANWASTLQTKIIKTVAERVEIQLDRDPSNTQSDWNRLELFLADSYREQYNLIIDEPPDADLLGPDVRPSEILFSIIEHQLNRRRHTQGIFQRIRTGKKLVLRGSYNELENTIIASRLLFEMLTVNERASAAGHARELGHLSRQFESIFENSTLLADQLFAVQIGLLRLVALNRQSLVDEVVQRK